MRRIVGMGLLLAAFVLMSSFEGFAQDPKKDKKNTMPVDSAKLDSGEFVGVLKTVPGSDRLFTMEVQTVKYVTVPGRKLPRSFSPRLLRGTGNTARSYNNAVNNLVKLNQNIATAQAQMASARNPGQRASAQRKLASLNGQVNRAVMQLQRAAVAAEAQLLREGIRMAAALPTLRAVPTKQRVEFQATELVKVRTMLLPEQFDDKGNPKKYTKEEKEALKGKDKKLPGYEASLEKLEAGQKLRVVLVSVKKPNDKTKDPGNNKDKAKDPDKDIDKDIDKDKNKNKDDEDDDKKKQVKTIIILEEAPANTPKGKRNKD